MACDHKVSYYFLSNHSIGRYLCVIRGRGWIESATFTYMVGRCYRVPGQGFGENPLPILQAFMDFMIISHGPKNWIDINQTSTYTNSLIEVLMYKALYYFKSNPKSGMLHNITMLYTYSFKANKYVCKQTTPRWLKSSDFVFQHP